MCTLTWCAAPEGAGYDLWFNRDELHTRAAEHAPARRDIEGTRVWAPTDGDHGGTWLTVNEHGLTIALVNYYPPDVPRRGLRSRGELPFRLAAAVDAAAARVRLEQLAGGGSGLAGYAPCHLVAVDGRGLGWWACWDATRLAWQPPPALLTSSSFLTREIEARRRERFDVVRPRDGAEFRAFHQHHDPQEGAASVCMRRPDAATRSLCHVAVRSRGSGSDGRLEYLTPRWMADRPVWDGASVAMWSAPVEAGR